MTTDWTAPSVDRSWPDRTSSERTSLDQWLDFQRITLMQKCSGLTGEQLTLRAAPPSRLSLLGLVRHMTEVERWWFRMHANQEDLEPIYCGPDNDEADFEDLDAANAEADLARYAAEVEAARAALAPHELDEVVPSRGHHPEATRNVRWIYVHMIEEYARHNGHADIIREGIDGASGD